MSSEQIENFQQMGLSEPLLRILTEVGYERPTPIQAKAIPILLTGNDLIGQAQTGTGKTAAFALPLLSRLDLARRQPQLLILTPTRELALQVAEALQRYATHLKGFHVLPIYGGQEYRSQIRALERGVHAVVGTPGRIMDHMRRGTLLLGGLDTVVLDEADEMLRMGFIDDVEWILEQTPAERQIALFSATMPPPIRAIANRHLRDPQEAMIEQKSTTASTIRQRYWMVSGFHRLDALTRMLETEQFEGMIVFVRTRTTTLELAEKLEARGFAAAPLNGDIPQAQRERTVEQLRAGRLDIVVATDVAARGLDVDRISHVINYDIPYDTESYIHRIGRTGRAGRSGDAILFVAPRERRLLQAIERATGSRIELMDLPSSETVNDVRIARFKQRITDTLATDELGPFPALIEQYQQEHNVSAIEIAAALARLLQGDQALLLEKDRPQERQQRSERQERYRDRPERFGREERERRGKPEWSGDRERGGDRGRSSDRERGGQAGHSRPSVGQLGRYRVEIGREAGIGPGHLLGTIASITGLDRSQVGRIEIHDRHSTIELPRDLPDAMLERLRRCKVSGHPLSIEAIEGGSQPYSRPDRPFEKRRDNERRPSTNRRQGDRKPSGPPRKRNRRDH
jgi:ATP-dependent RNA helicase DeaD